MAITAQNARKDGGQALMERRIVISCRFDRPICWACRCSVRKNRSLLATRPSLFHQPTFPLQPVLAVVSNHGQPRFHHYVLDESLMLDPERQFITIEMPQERYLFICRNRQVAFDPERFAASRNWCHTQSFACTQSHAHRQTVERILRQTKQSNYASQNVGSGLIPLGYRALNAIPGYYLELITENSRVKSE